VQSKCRTNISCSNIYPTRCNVTQFILSGNCSTCFGWYSHPSSGEHTTVSTTSGICHTVTANLPPKLPRYPFMTTALEGVRSQLHAPAALYPRERARTYSTRGWVGPMAGLEGWGKSRPPPGFDPRTVQPVASRYTDWATRPPRDICNFICSCNLTL